MRETMETNVGIFGFFGKYRPFSNYDTTPFIMNKIEFKSAEHAFHYYKTEDFEWKKRILEADTPSQAKKLGRQCPMRENWDSVKILIMENILIEKFGQNEHLSNLLLSTENKLLEETNDWGDTFWGVCNGKGSNNLGKILMRVRKYLKEIGDK